MTKKLFKNQYISSIITKFLVVVLGVLGSVFINRYLGPSLRGEYGYILNIINMVVLFLNLGVYQSYPSFKRNGNNQTLNKFLNIVLYQFLFYLLISIVLSLMLNEIKFIIIFTLTPLMVLSVQLSFLLLIEDFKLRNILKVGNQLFYTTLILLVYLLFPQKILYVFIVLYLKELFVVLVACVKLRSKFKLEKVDLQYIKRVLRVGFFPMLTMLLITMNYRLDVIILKWFVSFEEIGYYSVGVGLANQVWIIPDAFKDVLFSKTAHGDSIEDIKMSIKTNIYISLSLILLMIFMGKYVIRILYGVEYLPAYLVTVVIFFGLIPMIFYKMIITLFNATGKQRIAFNILCISVILNVIMNIIFIPFWGIVGAALASVISYTACGVLFTYTFIKSYNIRIKELFLFSTDEIDRIKRFFFREKLNEDSRTS